MWFIKYMWFVQKCKNKSRGATNTYKKLKGNYIIKKKIIEPCECDSDQK